MANVKRSGDEGESAVSGAWEDLGGMLLDDVHIDEGEREGQIRKERGRGWVDGSV